MLQFFHRVYDQKTRLDSWKMTYISEAWWFKKEQSTITTDGRKNADVYTIRIPNTNIVLGKRRLYCERDMQSKDADCEGSGRARKSKNHICKLQYLWRKSTHKGGGSVVAKGKEKICN